MQVHGRTNLRCRWNDTITTVIIIVVVVVVVSVFTALCHEGEEAVLAVVQQRVHRCTPLPV